MKFTGNVAVRRLGSKAWKLSGRKISAPNKLYVLWIKPYAYELIYNYRMSISLCNPLTAEDTFYKAILSDEFEGDMAAPPPNDMPPTHLHNHGARKLSNMALLEPNVEASYDTAKKPSPDNEINALAFVLTEFDISLLEPKPVSPESFQLVDPSVAKWNLPESLALNSFGCRKK